jgi:hypothetical protein
MNLLLLLLLLLNATRNKSRDHINDTFCLLFYIHYLCYGFVNVMLIKDMIKMGSFLYM